MSERRSDKGDTARSNKLAKVAKMVSDFRKRMDSVLLPARQLGKSFSKYLESSGILEAAGKLAEAMRQAVRYPEVMVEADWPPLPDVTLSQATLAVMLRNAHDLEWFRNWADHNVPLLYDDELIRERLETWGTKPFLSRRLRILQSGVAAHLRGDYACSVPTLLPQAEGIVVDYFNGVKAFETAAFTTRLEKLLRAGKGENPDRLQKAAYTYYRHTVMANVGLLEQLPLTMNRHLILHGTDVSYATKINSLKAILLIDFLQACYILVSIPNGDVYHRSGCPRLAQSLGKLQFHEGPTARGLRFKRPCRVCWPPRI